MCGVLLVQGAIGKESGGAASEEQQQQAEEVKTHQRNRVERRVIKGHGGMMETRKK